MRVPTRLSGQVFNNDPMIEVDVTDEAEGDCMYVAMTNRLTGS